MITVVCVYNDKKTMSDCLLRGLKAQAAKHELIALDNTKGRFKSAAEALNYGGNKARGKYVMFVHQDVSLPSPNMLGEIEKTLDGLPNLGIAGAAGISGETGHVASNIMHGKPPWTAGKLRIKAPMKMQTLDECLLLVPRSVFKTLKFDEQVCNDWHLYAVDYCLSARKLGFDAYVLPVAAHHMSTGGKTEKFYLTLGPLLKKHRDAGWIYTTTGFWNARIPMGLQKIRCFQLLVMGAAILLNFGIIVFIEDLHSFLSRHARQKVATAMALVGSRR